MPPLEGRVMSIVVVPLDDAPTRGWNTIGALGSTITRDCAMTTGAKTV